MAQLKDTSAFQVYSRPNFFELFLAEHLQESIYPAYRSLLSYLVSRFGNLDDDQHASLNSPSAYLAICLKWVQSHKTSLFYGASAVIESIHLSSYSASLSERFLGLRRVPSSSTSSSPLPLTSRQAILSLICLVGLPWALHRLKQLRHKHKWIAASLPYIKAALETASIFYTIAYIGNLTTHSSPLLHLSGLKLITDSSSAVATAAANKSIFSTVASTLADGLRLALPLAAFGWRSLEWWYSVPHVVSAAGSALFSSSSSASSDSSPSKAPPPDPPKLITGVTVQTGGNMCPLCGRPRHNPAVLAVSGFAFCYPCILPYVRQHNKCPVTGLPASDSQVRRIF